jgi:hypothetical protein
VEEIRLLRSALDITGPIECRPFSSCKLAFPNAQYFVALDEKGRGGVLYWCSG